MKNYKKNDATTKVRILKPILDDWNAIQGDNWVVERSQYGNKERVEIRRADRDAVRDAVIHESIHGSLVHDISCLCEAYSWCWAIYFDPVMGFYMSI